VVVVSTEASAPVAETTTVEIYSIVALQDTATYEITGLAIGTYYIFGVFYPEEVVTSFIPPGGGDKAGEYLDGSWPGRSGAAPAPLTYEGTTLTKKSFLLNTLFD